MISVRRRMAKAAYRVGPSSICVWTSFCVSSPDMVADIAREQYVKTPRMMRSRRDRAWRRRDGRDEQPRAATINDPAPSVPSPAYARIFTSAGHDIQAGTPLALLRACACALISHFGRAWSACTLLCCTVHVAAGSVHWHTVSSFPSPPR